MKPESVAEAPTNSRACVRGWSRSEPVVHHDDEELAARAGVGEGDAFQRLVVRYQDRIYRLATRMCASESDAEKTTQDTFLLAYRDIASFKGEARFSTWLYRIAVNAVLLRKRSTRRRPTESLEDYLPRFNDLGLIEASAGDLWSGAEMALERKRIAEGIADALGNLEEAHRAAFVLHDLEGFSAEEIARLTDSSAEAVRQRLHRARLMLRGYLGHLRST